MKVVFVASNLSHIGGIQNYNKNFLTALKRGGNEVLLVELKGLSVFAKIGFLFSFFWGVITFWPEVIVCTNINFSIPVFLAKKILGRRYVITMYGVESINIKNPLYVLAIKSAELIVTLFATTAANVARQIPEVKNRMFRLNNSVDGNRFLIQEKSKEFIGKYGLVNAKIILTVARLLKIEMHNKGYDRVIRAMPEVLKEIPNARYVLVGSGDDMSDMERLVKELNLEDRVVFVGSPKDDEMIDYYNLADVFVMPSKNEGFPAIVLLEALACGKPVVAGKYPYEGDYGQELWTLVPPDDTISIARAIISVLKGNLPKNSLDSETLRSKVLELYGIDSFNKNVATMIDSLKNE